MNHPTQHGLHIAQGLSEAQFAEINDLRSICNQHDNIDLKINLDMLRTRPTDQVNDILYYERGTLVGFLGMYHFARPEMEVSGMVHPLYRRKGIFKQLYEAAYAECWRREIPKIILICEHESASSHAFAQSVGGTYSFSEYGLRLEAEPEQKPVIHHLTYKEADMSDLGTLIRLDMSGFEMAEDAAHGYSMMSLNDSLRRLYMASLDGKPIGKMGIYADELEGLFIYGFCVLPEYQGRGMGRQILVDTITKLQAEGHREIQLEVEATNKNALGLYQSCGFREKSAQDYYVVMVGRFVVSV